VLKTGKINNYRYHNECIPKLKRKQRNFHVYRVSLNGSIIELIKIQIKKKEKRSCYLSASKNSLGKN
jgi:hypothetical protein